LSLGWSASFTASAPGIERGIALDWLWRHESGTYLKFTDSGAALFA
jgi:hypothetical protein